MGGQGIGILFVHGVALLLALPMGPAAAWAADPVTQALLFIKLVKGVGPRRVHDREPRHLLDEAEFDWDREQEENSV